MRTFDFCAHMIFVLVFFNFDNLRNMNSHHLGYPCIKKDV